MAKNGHGMGRDRTQVKTMFDSRIMYHGKELYASSEHLSERQSCHFEIHSEHESAAALERSLNRAV
jgi:hypothetical protein